MPQTTDSEQLPTAEEIVKAWANANFGPEGESDAGRRRLIKEALGDIVCGYRVAHTIESICKELGLLQDATEFDGEWLSMRGLVFLTASTPDRKLTYTREEAICMLDTMREINSKRSDVVPGNLTAAAIENLLDNLVASESGSLTLDLEGETNRNG